MAQMAGPVVRRQLGRVDQCGVQRRDQRHLARCRRRQCTTGGLKVRHDRVHQRGMRGASDGQASVENVLFDKRTLKGIDGGRCAGIDMVPSAIVRGQIKPTGVGERCDALGLGEDSDHAAGGALLHERAALTDQRHHLSGRIVSRDHGRSEFAHGVPDDPFGHQTEGLPVGGHGNLERHQRWLGIRHAVKPRRVGFQQCVAQCRSLVVTGRDTGVQLFREYRGVRVHGGGHARPLCALPSEQPRLAAESAAAAVDTLISGTLGPCR